MNKAESLAAFEEELPHIRKKFALDAQQIGILKSVLADVFDSYDKLIMGGPDKDVIKDSSGDINHALSELEVLIRKHRRSVDLADNPETMGSFGLFLTDIAFVEIRGTPTPLRDFDTALSDLRLEKGDGSGSPLTLAQLEAYYAAPNMAYAARDLSGVLLFLISQMKRPFESVCQDGAKDKGGGSTKWLRRLFIVQMISNVSYFFETNRQSLSTGALHELSHDVWQALKMDDSGFKDAFHRELKSLINPPNGKVKPWKALRGRVL